MTLREERPRLVRYARGDQHSEVAHRQDDVLGGAGQTRLAHCDGAIVLLVEVREELPEAERLTSGHDAERSRVRPAPLALREQLLGNRGPEKMSQRPEAGGLLRSAARHTRHA